MLLKRILVYYLWIVHDQNGDFIQYDFLEEVLFSSKYKSRMEYLTPCHVVVMMNEDPGRSKLSSDHYNIVKLNLSPKRKKKRP